MSTLRMPNLTPTVTVVVPAFNEAEGIGQAIDAIAGVLEACAPRWEIVVVDDGSRDGTFQRVCERAQADPRVKGAVLSRNFGKEAALLAGLRAATGDVVITIDADLQHPPTLIPEMLERWRAGAQIVHAVKRSRQEDTFFKRTAASAINGLVSRLGGINVHNSSDFKLLDRRVVDVLVHELPERVRFYRGLASWLGFAEDFIDFDVATRAESHSKWSLWALVNLSITALTSFTSLPLRIVLFLGLTTLILGFGVTTEAVWSWFQGQAVSGFATTIICVLVIGSFIMISLGVIGEYIAKIYEEIKRRPHYLLQASIGLEPSSRAGEDGPHHVPRPFILARGPHQDAPAPRRISS